MGEPVCKTTAARLTYSGGGNNWIRDAFLHKMCNITGSLMIISFNREFVARYLFVDTHLKNE